MKLVPLVSPATERRERKERRDRLRRDSAAAPVLRVLFPAVRQLHFELMFPSSSSTTPAAQSHVLHPPAQAFFEFPCPCGDCDGRFDLADAVNAAVVDQSHIAKGTRECSGKRAQRSGSKETCQLRLIYTVTATYHRHDGGSRC